jgi:ABC-type dipeptide/oligopeptide/nickel transport system ATPase component
MAVLEVKDLVVQFGETKVVNNVSFSLEPREILGIVGESGSGKTMTALSIMKLLPPTAKVSGSILFDGKDVLSIKEKEMEKIRGRKISMIFQDPRSSLNPVISVGEQAKEMPRYHRPDIKKKDQKKFVISLLKKIGIPDPEKRYSSFPHELSGGMNQRIVIAMMAMVTNPLILIADEPTTALDVTIQANVLDILNSLVKELGISLILITHNLGIISEYADNVLVMKKGEIVDRGTVFQIFNHPRHPYTKHLLKVVPKL